ncbi:MAG TPA: histidinol-phosphatase [Bacteroidales bacterium]|nr:histidinol-phosphatase [Bacteroidales bacterium]
MIYRTDYHVHTTFSDGRAKPEEYVIPAINAGLSEIGFSDHITLFLEKQPWNMDPGQIHSYIDYMLTLKEKTKDIKVKIGLEVDYFPCRDEEIREYLDPLPLDYVIGSVHYQGKISVDECREYYENGNLDNIFELYFKTVGKAAESGLFNIIGHLDLVRIYGFRPLSYPEHLYRELAKTLKSNDVVFEVNTNGRNRPIADFYPDRRFLKAFINENAGVCVNSDAHMPSRLAQYFDEAYDLLRYTGFSEMATFEGRKRTMIPF